MPAWAQQLFEEIERAEGGVQALGAASQGRHEMLLGPWSLVAAKARERLDRACAAAQELQTFLKEAKSPHSLHLAWSVLTRSLAQTLTYDCRLVPPDVLHPIAVQLDAMVRRGVVDLLGHPLDDSNWQQLTLPGPLSGCAVLSSVSRSPAAFVTTRLQLRGRVDQLVNAFGLPASLDKQDAEVAKAVLAVKDQGAIITDTLKLEFEPHAKDLYDKSPFAHDICSSELPKNCHDFDAAEFHGKGLLSRVSRVLAAVQAAKLHEGLDDESRQIAILSASGESVGQFWTHSPVCRREAFENLWFRTSLRQRLHLSITSSGQSCQLRKADCGEELCLEELTERQCLLLSDRSGTFPASQESLGDAVGRFARPWSQS